MAIKCAFISHFSRTFPLIQGGTDEYGEYQVNCKYFEASDFVNALNESKCDFAALSFNIWSLPWKWDVLCLQERNWDFATNANFLIPLSLQFNRVH